jgi:hypothetical protein
MNYPEKNFARFYRQPGLASVHYMAVLLNFTVCYYKVSRYVHPTCITTTCMRSGAAPRPMSKCTLCGATFSCAMVDNTIGACWCTTLPAAVPLPEGAAGCWCRTCLETHIAELARTKPTPALAENPEPKK